MQHLGMTLHQLFTDRVGGCSKTLESNEELQTNAVFYIKTSSCEEMSSASESYLIALYKAPRSIVTLNKLRYHAYNTLVRRQKESAAFDMAAVSPQVQLTNSTRIVNSIICSNGCALIFKLTTGMELSSNNMKPVTTEDSPASPILMKQVFCNCQGGCSASSRMLLS